MRKWLFVAPFLLLLNACGDTNGGRESERKALAERFFRGVYGCDPSVVDELAADSVVVSYPIFERLYNTSALRGRKAVRDFAERFCSRWSDAQFTFHEAVAERDRVVLLWSFSARFVSSETGQPNQPPVNQKQSWGGITLYRFNEVGKIVAEIGEESAPGPFERVDVGESVK
ncbi:MAG: hypothetical protein E4H27_03395 [Anaerolineales bacterium]|jgi:hypothetical protein|nr:MAG: hypothetical protein E4H27_03395 [Anaerolineales bacterium]